MSLIKVAVNWSALKESLVNAAKGKGVKDELNAFSNGHLMTKFKNPGVADKVKHLLTTKEGLKAVAPTAALYGGAAIAAGSVLKPSKKD